MRKSIHEVAELANVSAMTVSRVLRGHGSLVRPETRERVLAAVRKLEYVPVRYSAQNRHVQTKVIGLVPYYLHSAHSDIDRLTNDGIIQAAHENDYDLLMMLRDEAEWEDTVHQARFLDRRSDGFIFISICPHEWEASLDALVKNNIISVVCYRRDVPKGVAWVDPDNEQLVRLAIGCLERRGHRRIAYIAGPSTLQNEQPRLPASQSRRAYDDVQREFYFQKTCEDSSGRLDCSVLHYVTPDSILRREVFDEILRRGITGLLCINDYVAVQLIKAARLAGVAIPQDLSIIGTDGLEISEPYPLVTTQSDDTLSRHFSTDGTE
jgi:DNA-binding LacI/PurR family transcriptional regulator